MSTFNLSRNITALLLAFASISAFAQDSKPSRKHEKWELGLFLGASQGQNDIQNIDTKEMNLGFGGIVRYHFNDNIGLRLNLLQGTMTGDDANYTRNAARNFSFSSPVTEGAVLLEFDLLGHRRYRNLNSGGKFKKIVSPYIFGGAGYALSNAKVNYNENSQPAQVLAQINQDKATGISTGQVAFPIGAGLKFDLSPSWVLNLEVGSRLLLNDNIEGISAAGNPDRNDAYSFSGLILSYRLNTVKDRDGDGVADDKDACPDVKGIATMMGCPDTDGDGVTDKMDACPDVKGAKELRGCPDTDGDGIADKDDACPDVKGTTVLKGCPDRDSDGIADKDDACPDTKGITALMGCPDTDGDGIADKDDACPTVKGTKEMKGCPAIADRDNDGIADKDDACPDKAGPAKFKGCPDTDGDGIEDPKDKCPMVAGLLKNQGCPDIKEADKKVLEAAIYGVEFETSKAAFKQASYTILNQVVDVMNRYPEYSLTISGHTDSQGDNVSNQKLSESRAKACYDYFITKNIAPARMSHGGFGETKPVADNNTAAGRAKNRRVEFALSVK